VSRRLGDSKLRKGFSMCGLGERKIAGGRCLHARFRSLFEPIDIDRTCAEAGVPWESCPCLPTTHSALTTTQAEIVTTSVERFLNNIDGVGRGPCPRISLDSTVYAPTVRLLSKQGAEAEVLGVTASLRSSVRDSESDIVFGVWWEMTGVLEIDSADGSRFTPTSVQMRSRFEQNRGCTPKGGNPEFCLCRVPPDFVKPSVVKWQDLLSLLLLKNKTKAALTVPPPNATAAPPRAPRFVTCPEVYG
jgi:Protein of unknown function (DUF229)